MNSPTPIPLDPHALDGFGRGGARGCVIDLNDMTLRAGAVATGLIWHVPTSAQYVAVLDVAAGRIERPSDEALSAWPDWARNSLAYYDEHGAPE